MTRVPDHLSILERDLRGIFADRLQSLVVYGLHASAPSESHAAAHPAVNAAAQTSTLAIISSMREPDLKACAEQVGTWHAAGLATPLLLASGEFERSLDAFPLEFGAIIADYVVVSGPDPFAGLTIDPADIRRACEVQARSHLLHLRQGFVETAGNANALAMLTVRSAGPFAALVTSVARLQGLVTHDKAAAGRHAERQLQLSPGVVTDVVKLAQAADISAAEATRIFAPYLDATERLVQYVDGWGAA
jgi:hypothetical protein